MSEIRTKPASRAYRNNFDRIFKKQHPQRLCCSERLGQDDASAPLGVTSYDENIDWGEFKTQVCVNNDPHFGG